MELFYLLGEQTFLVVAQPKSDINIYCYHYNFDKYIGRLGTGNEYDMLKPYTLELPDDENIVMVAAGDRHSLALTKEGFIYAWGNGTHGQLGTGDTRTSQLTPMKINLSMVYHRILYKRGTCKCNGNIVHEQQPAGCKHILYLKKNPYRCMNKHTSLEAIRYIWYSMGDIH